MKRLIKRFKQWWSNKNYEQQQRTLLNANLSIMVGMLIAFFMNPIVSLPFSILLITTGAYSLIHKAKHKEKIQQEEQEVEKEAKVKKVDELMKEERERTAKTLDKDTREAVEALFSSDSKTTKQEQAVEVGQSQSSAQKEL